jgi:hypothetical protein
MTFEHLLVPRSAARPRGSLHAALSSATRLQLGLDVEEAADRAG